MAIGGTWICGGTLVLPDRVSPGSLYIEGNLIRAIDTSSYRQVRSATSVQIIDATGMYVIPGLIDIHNDAIEREVQPRPNTLFPLDLALYEFERKVAGNGITTMYHSLSLGARGGQPGHAQPGPRNGYRTSGRITSSWAAC